jgi:hypothetical protein
MAEWLYKIKPRINISDINNFAFKYACENNHLDVAQWLYEIKPNINISLNNEEAFRNACSHGNLDMAQWLYKIKPNINISCGNDYAFRNACRNGHLVVAQWLYEIKPRINIGDFDNFAFKHACENNHLDVAKWLCDCKSNYHIEINNNRIINWKIYRMIPIDESKQIYIIKMYVCPICHETNSNIETNCAHSYCLACITIWYNRTSKCPLCRQQITHVYNLINKK